MGRADRRRGSVIRRPTLYPILDPIDDRRQLSSGRDWRRPQRGDDANVCDWPGRGTAKADGSLPDIDFMRLVAGSHLIDAGVDVGLPYNGSAPDLGYFETAAIVPPSLAGDYNGDGVVDAADYTVWRDTFGQTGADLAADGDT